MSRVSLVTVARAGAWAGSLPLASRSLPVTLLVGSMTGEAQGHQKGWGKFQGPLAEEGTRGPGEGGGGWPASGLRRGLLAAVWQW